jgi:hypothetical protein
MELDNLGHNFKLDHYQDQKRKYKHRGSRATFKLLSIQKAASKLRCPNTPGIALQYCGLGSCEPWLKYWHGVFLPRFRKISVAIWRFEKGHFCFSAWYQIPWCWNCWTVSCPAWVLGTDFSGPLGVQQALNHGWSHFSNPIWECFKIESHHLALACPDS